MDWIGIALGFTIDFYQIVMNPSAKEFIPKWVQSPIVAPSKMRYTKAQMKALQKPTIEAIKNGPVVDVPPFQAVPASLQHYLRLRNYIEYVDIDHASATVEHSSVTIPGNDPVLNYYCVQCSQGPQPCHSVGEIITNVRRREQQNVLGAFLFQPGDVVMGLVQLLLVFDSKKSSMKMRNLKERHPKVVQLVKEYLCGEGFHIPPPAVTAHEQWRVLVQKLKFDCIRDSKTIVYTELSKYWKKSHTQFEQFAHFLFFRDDVPAHRTKNMITHAQKPVIVAALSGDVEAFVMLSELGFFVPPDYYWSFPFFKDAILDEKLYSVLRHLCIYYYQRQSERATSGSLRPISPPGLRPSPFFQPKTALEAVIGGAASHQLPKATCTAAEAEAETAAAAVSTSGKGQ